MCNKTNMNSDDMQNLERTQPMPRVNPDLEAQPTQMLNVQKVRELEPVKIKNTYQENTDNGNRYEEALVHSLPSRRHSSSKGSSKGKKKMTAVLALGFVVAAFLGAALSGYMSEQQAKKAALDDQGQQAARQLQEADSQKQSLEQQKADLEEKYQQLLSQQKEAQSLADKLKGQQEQQAKSSQDKSAAGKIVDKVTGDAAKQKKEAAATEAKASQAQHKLEDLNQSVQAAGAAIDEINAQMENLEDVRQQAQAVKDDVSRAYNENKDVVDSLLHYAALGVESFQGLLAK